MPSCRLVASLLWLLCAPALAATPRTFCNPIDIDYGPVVRGVPGAEQIPQGRARAGIAWKMKNVASSGRK
jgi:hypothetical protein